MPSPSLTDCPLPGHVLLLLLPDGEFGLHIPIRDLSPLCIKPLKYLRYLAWVVLYLEGKITCNGIEVDEENGALKDQQTYRFEPTPSQSWENAQPMNAEIAERHSAFDTHSSRLDELFAANLQERDIQCVFTGYPWADATHIIPFSKGNEWLECLINGRFPDRRTGEGEDLNELDIDHVSNGLMACGGVCTSIDRRVAAVLVTPNRILSCDDIHPPPTRLFKRAAGIDYPAGARYTFQWLNVTGRSSDELRAIPNNSDAAFNSASMQPRPSPFLLECMYAATVINFWGIGSSRLKSHPGFVSAPPRRPAALHEFNPVYSGRQIRSSASAAGEPSDANITDEENMLPCSTPADPGADAIAYNEGDDPWDFILKLSHLLPQNRDRLVARQEQREIEREEHRTRIVNWLDGVDASEDTSTSPISDAPDRT